MRRYLVEINTLGDWQARLGDPVRHWKRGASAMELAVAWTIARANPRRLPPDVASLLDSVDVLAGAELDIAIPELTTALDTSRAPSQTDLWALLRVPAGKKIVMTIEGKAREPFAETVDRWMAAGSRSDGGASPTRKRRLEFLVDHLGLDASSVGELRYQLLHRTVACLLEANAWNASIGVMLVQRFSPEPEEVAPSWHDYSVFASRLGIEAVPGSLARAHVPGDAELYLGWLDCRTATDQEILAATLESASSS